MNILFLAPYVPSRIRVRSFQIIKELSKKHNVHVVALGEPEKSGLNAAEDLLISAKNMHIIPHSRFRGFAQSLIALPSTVPMCTSFCWSPAMAKRVNDLINNEPFDLVHVEHLRAAHFVPKGCKVPVLFDSVDCLTGLFSQLANANKNPVSRFVMQEEAWCLKRYEPRELKRFDRVIITSESEKSAVKALNANIHVDVVPNGVDTDYFSPISSEKYLHRFVFNGKMSYSPNAQAAVWFAKNVFPALRAKWPDAEFVIVGSNPPQQVKRLTEYPGVVVTGYVDDIRPHLASASIAVAPMQVAVGVQNKILEAMAMGLPVVASSLASRAFGPSCKGILQADSSIDVFSTINKLVSDDEFRNATAQAGLQEVRTKFSWQSSVAFLEAIYEELIESRAKKGGAL